MDYTAIPKGCGFVYEHQNHLYRRVRTKGSTKYLKCTVVGCDGSAKLIGDQFIVGVSKSFLDYEHDGANVDQISAGSVDPLTFYCHLKFSVPLAVMVTKNSKQRQKFLSR